VGQEVHRGSGNSMTHLALGCSPESDPSLAAMEECCRTGAEYCAQAHKHTSTQAHKRTSTQARKHARSPYQRVRGLAWLKRYQPVLENTALTQCPVRVSCATIVGLSLTSPGPNGCGFAVVAGRSAHAA
jgi:hypothetical protein